MQRKTPVFLFMSVLVFITLSNTFKVASTGAPIGSTGAPGETNCARSGCHTGDNNLNTGTGVTGISIDDFNGMYIPGKTYQVTVSLQQQGIKRFGFSLSAINKGNISSGALLATDVSRTQVLKGSNQFAEREYITYKVLGTNPYAENTGKWTFQWTAPDQYEGPVTLYLAAVSANNDGTDKGDEVYTDSLVLNGFATGLSTTDPDPGYSVYPNPVKENFTISFVSRDQINTKISLTDLKGGSSYVLFDDILYKGIQKLGLVKPTHLPKGIYLIHIEQGIKVFTQKIVIE